MESVRQGSNLNKETPYKYTVNLISPTTEYTQPELLRTGVAIGLSYHVCGFIIINLETDGISIVSGS